MAKRKKAQDNLGMFQAVYEKLSRRIRRQRALFIPKFLYAAAIDQRMASPERENAYQIIRRWAERESAGLLVMDRETSIDTQFLDQVFGEGLGYQVKTNSPQDWQMEHKFSVEGVGIADATLGEFPKVPVPLVAVELKDASTDLDRSLTKNRSPVRQCWDYINAMPGCLWGIVSNFSTIRLYHQPSGNQAYEEFSLKEMSENRQRFDEFYYIFERGGLLHSKIGQEPRALGLLERTIKAQREVGDALYDSYQSQRLHLIEHLMAEHQKPFDTAIRIAQKLLDRIIFIAFCEDRDLLLEQCLERAWKDIPPFSKAVNPRWENFLGLFHQVDRGGPGIGLKEGYNGNLFKPDDEIDNLKLSDSPWTDGFKNFGSFDFSQEVNVEVLGHLFERSITELEKLRVGGLFALKAGTNGNSGNGKKPANGANGNGTGSKMQKSAQRKRFGIYYTPPAFTGLIVERTIDVLVQERFTALAKQYKIDLESRKAQNPKAMQAYWQACLEDLKTVTVCDPACGSGAFLIRAYDALDAHYKTIMHGLGAAGVPPEEVHHQEESIPNWILNHNLFGVDLSEESVEITQLALWIRSARRNHKLSDLSKHIVCGNSLVSDPAVDPKALDWHKTFPSIFGKEGPGGFSCVIGNPPWEQVMLYEREFFGVVAPEIGSALNTADRTVLIGKLEVENPELFKRFNTAKHDAEKLQTYLLESEKYPKTAKGRANTFSIFAELAESIVTRNGLVGLLLPSGIATDMSTKAFFYSLMEDDRLVSLFDFENRKLIFPDVDPRFKFSVLVFGGHDRKHAGSDFVFFAHRMGDLEDRKRHIQLSLKDLQQLNPNTMTCPIFRTTRDTDITKEIYRTIPILILKSRRKGGNPWGLRFKQGLFNQSADSGLFKSKEQLNKMGYELHSNVWKLKSNRFLPLCEAKMVQAFDHRAASVVIDKSNWVRQGQTDDTSVVDHQNPEFTPLPRYWVSEENVLGSMDGKPSWGFVAFKDITSATNTRTMIAAAIPWLAVPHPLPLIFTQQSTVLEMCLLGNLNAYIYDYVARQKVGGTHLTFFIVEQLPTLPPDTYADKCPWSKKETLEHWISERVLKLTCTAEDMIPLARACGFKGRGDGVHIWKEAERAQLRAELDAAYFHLYGIEREDVEYILSTFTNTGLAPKEQREARQFLWTPGSMGSMILEAYDSMM